MTEKRATMKEISHTPPAGETVTNVWNRGQESVEADSTPEPAVEADD